MKTIGTHEAAKLLGVNAARIVQLVREGRLSAIKAEPGTLKWDEEGVRKGVCGPNGAYRFTLKAIQACRKRIPLKRGPKSDSVFWIRHMRKSGPKRQGEDQSPNGWADFVAGPFDSARKAEEERKKLPDAYALVVVREKGKKSK